MSAPLNIDSAAALEFMLDGNSASEFLRLNGPIEPEVCLLNSASAWHAVALDDGLDLPERAFVRALRSLIAPAPLTRCRCADCIAQDRLPVRRHGIPHAYQTTFAAIGSGSGPAQPFYTAPAKSADSLPLFAGALEPTLF